MSDEFTLDAEVRTDNGKGASRRLRREHKVPAIIYGSEIDSQPITLSHHQVIRRLENEAFYSHVLVINVDGKNEEAILRDIQRHPSKPQILHMDFLRVSKDKVLHVHVPLHLINEEKCVGVKLGGGIISKIITEVEVACLPKDLPEYLEVDVIDLNVGDSIHLTELKLPEGIHLLALSHGGEHDTSVVSVHKPRGSAEDEDTGAPAEVTAEVADEKEGDS
jgi:large subunit ribosomal protein L25